MQTKDRLVVEIQNLQSESYSCGEVSLMRTVWSQSDWLKQILTVYNYLQHFPCNYFPL